MHRSVALASAATLVAVALAACGGGSKAAPHSDVVSSSAEKAACKQAPDFSRGSAGRFGVRSTARAAALPPEPVQDLLPKAKFVVEARVAKVLYNAETPDEPNRGKNVIGPAPPERCQVVQLEVDRVVMGDDPSTSVTVVKPLAPYTLERGRHASGLAFIVTGADPYPIILGRYGPYPVSDVEQVLATLPSVPVSSAPVSSAR